MTSSELQTGSAVLKLMKESVVEPTLNNYLEMNWPPKGPEGVLTEELIQEIPEQFQKEARKVMGQKREKESSNPSETPWTEMVRADNPDLSEEQMQEILKIM